MSDRPSKIEVVCPNCGQIHALSHDDGKPWRQRDKEECAYYMLPLVRAKLRDVETEFNRLKIQSTTYQDAIFELLKLYDTLAEGRTDSHLTKLIADQYRPMAISPVSEVENHLRDIIKCKDCPAGLMNELGHCTHCGSTVEL